MIRGQNWLPFVDIPGLIVKPITESSCFLPCPTSDQLPVP